MQRVFVSSTSRDLENHRAAVCSPGPEATAGQTVALEDGSRWLALTCDGGTGWFAEDSLPPAGP